MLTDRLNDVLGFIKDYATQHDGVMPSYREIATGVALSSPSAAFKMINRLEERGYVRRIPGKSRALRIIEDRDAAQFQNDLVAQLKACTDHIQCDRDTLFEVVTNEAGEYTHPDDAEVVAELDQILAANRNLLSIAQTGRTSQ